MCTLSYLPREDGYFVVNNRDESPLRASTLQPELIKINGFNILSPMDNVVKGTWIGVNDGGRMVCLMNGAFINHVKKSSYRKSRGKITLEFLTAPDVLTYFKDSDFKDIEPFTLVIIDTEDIKVFRWDELEKYSEILAKDKPYNWSSSTLYDREIAESRLTYYLSNINSFYHQDELLLAWHTDRIFDTPKMLLNRPMVKTISITTIENLGDSFEMVYHDLINQNIFTRHCDIKEQLHDAY